MGVEDGPISRVTIPTKSAARDALRAADSMCAIRLAPGTI
jgi:hypothetical protein